MYSSFCAAAAAHADDAAMIWMEIYAAASECLEHALPSAFSCIKVNILHSTTMRFRHQVSRLNFSRIKAVEPFAFCVMCNQAVGAREHRRKGFTLMEGRKEARENAFSLMRWAAKKRQKISFNEARKSGGFHHV